MHGIQCVMEYVQQARYRYWPDEEAPVVTAKHYTVHLLDEGKEGREGEGRKEEEEGEKERAREGAGRNTERRTFKVEHCTVSEQYSYTQHYNDQSPSFLPPVWAESYSVSIPRDGMGWRHTTIV